MGYAPPIPRLIPSADGSTFGVRGWNVCVPGWWNKELLSHTRIKGIVDVYRHLKKVLGDRFSPKVRFGHDTKQRLAQSLGLPNVGRVTDVRPTANGGFEVDCDGIPRRLMVWNPQAERLEVFDLFAAFQAGNYDSGSIELTRWIPDPSNPARRLYDVFDGIALLGEEQPAIRAAAGLPTTVGSDDPSRLTLTFSAYSEVPEMDPRTKLAQLMGLDPTDPTVAGMSPEAVDKMLASMGNQTFADRYKKCFADMPPVMPPAGGAGGAGGMPPGGDPDPTKVMMSADVVSRLSALEAQNEELRKSLLANAKPGQITMSEAANRRLTQCVQDGKVSKALADTVYRPEIDKLAGLPSEKAVFSDGANKGRTQLDVYLADLESRPPNIFFSESIQDDPAQQAGGLSAWAQEALSLSANGRDALDYAKRQKNAA